MKKDFKVGQVWICRGGPDYGDRTIIGINQDPDYPIKTAVVTPAGREKEHMSFDAEGFNCDPSAHTNYDLVDRRLVVYVAGPMSGYPDLNFPAFHAKAAELRALGYVVINPAEINGGADEQAATAAMSPEQYKAHWLKCMRKDITELVTCDGIAMLDGWTKSKGATLEHHIARALGLTIFEAAA